MKVILKTKEELIAEGWKETNIGSLIKKNEFYLHSAMIGALGEEVEVSYCKIAPPVTSRGKGFKIIGRKLTNFTYPQSVIKVELTDLEKVIREIRKEIDNE